MARVFVSHASADASAAQRIATWLTDDGNEVFLARDPVAGIIPGDDWQQRLHERLRWADAVVCVVTAAYCRSAWCAAEVGVAQSRGSRLIPVGAEPGVVHPLLASTQGLDASGDERTVRAQMAGWLRAVDARGGLGWPDDRSPFPGLRAFDTDQHLAFFGREADTERLATHLRSPADRLGRALLAVVGPSGCGKSSFVRAGLLPVMAAEPDWWTVPAVVPGRDPVAALARTLAAAARELGLPVTVTDVLARLGDDRFAGLADDILVSVPGRRRHLLVVVDQFEEVFTHAGDAERTAFARLLRSAVDGPIQIVATVRPEFLDVVLTDPTFAGLSVQTHVLRPLERDGLRAAVEGPTELAGITLEQGLVERLVDDTASGEALPLLAYALANLTEGVSRGQRLRAARYEELGGVRGALAQQADAALAQAMAVRGRDRDAVVGELLRLVTVDEDGRPRRWRARRAELPTEVAAELDAFVARRLLTTDLENGGVDEGVVVGVAHEAFLSAWEPLAAAIARAAAGLRARRAVERAADEWQEAGRPAALLWERGQLAAAVEATGTRLERGLARLRPARRRSAPPTLTTRVALSTGARTYLTTAIRRDRRRRRRSTTILTLLLVLALAAGVVAFVQRGRATERQELATARLLAAQSRDAVGRDPRTAIRLAEAAYRIQPDGETRSALVGLLHTTRYTGRTDDDTPTYAVAFTRAGDLLATGGLDGSVRLWDMRDGRPRPRGAPLSAGPDAVSRLAFSPDGRTLLAGTIAAEDELVGWALPDGAEPVRRTVPGSPGEPVTGIVFTPDGRTAVTSGVYGAVAVWTVGAPGVLQPVAADPPLDARPGQAVLALGPDGRTLAVSRPENGVVGLYDIADPARPTLVRELRTKQSGPFRDLQFFPDSPILASVGGAGGDVELWNLAGDPVLLSTSGGTRVSFDTVVNSVAFNADGTAMITANDDGSAQLWDTSNPAQPARVGAPFVVPDGYSTLSAFSPDGRRVVSGGPHGATLWDTRDGGAPALVDRLSLTKVRGAPGGVSGRATTVSADGTTLAAADEGGALSLWQLADPADPKRLGNGLPLTTDVTTVALSPDGRLVATAGRGAAVTLWDVAAGTRIAGVTGSGGEVGALAFTPDGTRLAVLGTEQVVRLWDVAHLADGVPATVELPASGDRMAFRRDGRMAAVGDATGAVSLVDLSDRRGPVVVGGTPGRPQQLTFPGPATLALAFSPDGRTLATGNPDRTIGLWDVSQPARPHPVGDPLLGHRALVGDLAFTPDGLLLASNGGGETILWDLSDPARPLRLGAPLRTDNSPSAAVGIATRGRTLVTSAAASTIELWDLQEVTDFRADAVTRACGITGGGFGTDEWSHYTGGLRYADACPPDTAPPASSVPDHPAAPAPLAAAPTPLIVGRWSGTYVCGQGTTGLTLTVEPGHDAGLAATFDFHPVAEQPDVPSGVFRMHGTAAADGSFRLTSTHWLLPPPSGYQMVNMQGSISPDGAQLQGSIVGYYCNDFTLRRA